MHFLHEVKINSDKFNAKFAAFLIGLSRGAYL
jgi:hypothetical protein